MLVLYIKVLYGKLHSVSNEPKYSVFCFRCTVTSCMTTAFALGALLATKNPELIFETAFIISNVAFASLRGAMIGHISHVYFSVCESCRLSFSKREKECRGTA